MKCAGPSTRIKNPSRPNGYTLLELLLSAGISSIVLAAIIVTFTGINRTLVGMANYADLDRQSRSALDRMLRDIRSTGQLTNCSTNALWFTNKDGAQLSFS